MSASFTFGSFGDIITIVQLVWQLSQAISDSHGSAQEFRDLVDELSQYHRALDEVSWLLPFGSSSRSRGNTDLQNSAVEVLANENPMHRTRSSCRLPQAGGRRLSRGDRIIRPTRVQALCQKLFTSKGFPKIHHRSLQAHTLEYF